jgi:hypothetical protein
VGMKFLPNSSREVLRATASEYVGVEIVRGRENRVERGAKTGLMTGMKTGLTRGTKTGRQGARRRGERRRCGDH